MTRIFLLMLSGILASGTLPADDEVFARQGDQVLTQSEIDAAFMRIPQKYRLAFIRDGERVDQLVASLLRYKQIAAEAAQNGFDKQLLVADRMKLAQEKELAEAWVDHMVESAPAGDYEALAYERYLASPEKFQSDVTLNVSHILIQSETRPEAEALETVNRLHAELIENPALFDEYIMEYSEDPAKANNSGHYTRMTRGQMVKPFEDAAFAMTEAGTISDPVKTAYGYHIIRLNRRMESQTLPFEQVKMQLMAEVEQEHIDSIKRTYLAKLTGTPIEIPDGAIEKMAKRHFGEELEKAPPIYDQ